jgi:phosphoribosyl 1,2-cyclic phosphodiesterase
VKICILRSGSSGNCSVIENDGQHILLDSGGMSQKKIREILSEINLTPEQISALVVTHTHSDHINYSTLKICEKCSIPIFIHRENIDILHRLHGSSIISKLNFQTFENDRFLINDSTLFTPFPVSHDAEKVTCGFSVENQDGKKFSYAADLGCFTQTLIPYFSNIHTLIIEANHDVDLLWNNTERTFFHKKRVSGDFGHLSNIQTADALIAIIECCQTLPDRIIFCHLSKDHNSPELALATIKDILDKKGIYVPLYVAERYKRTEFFEI